MRNTTVAAPSWAPHGCSSATLTAPHGCSSATNQAGIKRPSGIDDFHFFHYLQKTQRNSKWLLSLSLCLLVSCSLFYLSLSLFKKKMSANKRASPSAEELPAASRPKTSATPHKAILIQAYYDEGESPVWATVSYEEAAAFGLAKEFDVIYNTNSDDDDVQNRGVTDIHEDCELTRHLAYGTVALMWASPQAAHCWGRFQSSDYSHDIKTHFKSFYNVEKSIEAPGTGTESTGGRFPYAIDHMVNLHVPYGEASKLPFPDDEEEEEGKDKADNDAASS
jgi:hypothetical protein